MGRVSGLDRDCMAFFLFQPDDGYSAWNILLQMASFGLAYLIFWASKKFATLPRMGQGTFGPARNQKKTTLAIILGIVLLNVAGWLNPELGAKIKSFLQRNSQERLAVAAVAGALLVGPAMILIASSNDFSCGYYMSILMSLAIFLMNQTGLTWGNLSAHMSNLEDAGYWVAETTFKGKRLNTTLQMTPQGWEAFWSNVKKMKQVFQDLKG